MKFTHDQMKVVARLYHKYQVPLDQLPYTETIEQMFAEFCQNSTRNPITGETITLRDFWMGLLNLRKAGELGKLQKTR